MKIKFQPTGQEIDVDPSKTLLQLCIDNKIEIKSICKGVPSCTECRVKILSGEHNVLPPEKNELQLIGTNYFLDQKRLSCQMRCFGPVTIDLTEQLQKLDKNNQKKKDFKLPVHTSSMPHEITATQSTLVLEKKNTPAKD
jgi:2Fe-2S ferredoxin